jgi:hypothetical protein
MAVLHTGPRDKRTRGKFSPRANAEFTNGALGRNVCAALPAALT